MSGFGNEITTVLLCMLYSPEVDVLWGKGGGSQRFTNHSLFDLDIALDVT